MQNSANVLRPLRINALQSAESFWIRQSLVMEIYSNYRISSSSLKPSKPLEKLSDLSVTEHCKENRANIQFKSFPRKGEQMFILVATANADSQLTYALKHKK